jgi:hypothetical protein
MPMLVDREVEASEINVFPWLMLAGGAVAMPCERGLSGEPALGSKSARMPERGSEGEGWKSGRGA